MKPGEVPNKVRRSRNALRASNALTLSLVAEMDGRVVGHIAFPPVTISDGSLDWYGLGPVSVLPEYHRQGIGKSLIQEGLSSLKALGGQGCVLVGDPYYYKRFGFRNLPELIHEGIPQEVFLALPFNDRVPHGIVVFHKGFSANGQRMRQFGPAITLRLTASRLGGALWTWASARRE